MIRIMRYTLGIIIAIGMVVGSPFYNPLKDKKEGI
jgi:hypothetical protein